MNDLIDILNGGTHLSLVWPVGRPFCVQSPIDGELFFYKDAVDADMRIPGCAYRPGIFLSVAEGCKIANVRSYKGIVG